ncbi:MAG: SPOR domain-containing protein [Pseudomonadota bacterium]
MKVTRVIAIAVIAASAALAGAQAQNLRNNQTPAEFPPASYKSTQYVDSRGCVFIRAGIDGNVTWVPRVNRQRRLICGQTPSLSGTQVAAAQAATPKQAKPPVQITVDAPLAATTPTPKPAPRPTAKPVAAPKPKPKPKPTVTAETKPAPKPAAAAAPTRRVIVRTAPPAAPKPTPAPPVQQARVAPAAPAAPVCRGGNTVSQKYINGNTNAQYPVRCGPQSSSPSIGGYETTTRQASAVTVRRGTTQTATVPTTVRRVPARSAAVSQQTRVMPAQVFDRRVQEIGADRVPAGFRPAWEDDRLNPRRAEQSLEGIARTRLIWSNTVPRRLIDRQTGNDVTAKVPLVYPYTDVATQQRDLGTVTLVRRDGQLMKRIVRNRAKARTPTVSTRSAPAPKAARVVRAQPKAQPQPQQPTAPAPGPSGRFVQVGTFGVPSNAQATARRLQQAGLPVRIGAMQRGSKQYQIVMAGPFTSSQTLSQGLKTARSLGFGDAFVR